MLLQAGVNVNMADWRGETAVLKALLIQDVDISRMLIDANANVAAVQNGTTPLHLAAYHGNPNLVEMLLADRQNSRELVTARDCRDTRPLEEACKGCPCHPWVDEDRARIMKILLDNGADAERAWRRRSTRLLCRVVYPLHEACKTNDEETVKRLLDTTHGPGGIDVNSKNFVGQTPLYLGCTSGNIEIVRMVRLLFSFSWNSVAQCKLSLSLSDTCGLSWSVGVAMLRPPGNTHEITAVPARCRCCSKSSTRCTRRAQKVKWRP